MPDIDRSEQALDGEIIIDETPRSVELVPVIRPVNWSPKSATVHPDPTFVTHLIATAAQAPQTRFLRRASLADAQTAYGAGHSQRHATGVRTRQTA